MKEKKNIILLVVAIIFFLVALGFFMWSMQYNNTNDANQDVSSTNKTINTVPDEGIEPQREVENSNTQDVEGVSYQDITVYAEDESEIKLSEYSETPIMLLFWNPENEDSVEVLKKVNTKYGDYKEKIKFLMISTSKEIPEEIKNEISMEIYYDLNNECQEKYNVATIPTMVYIDDNNEVINAKSGVPSNDAIEANLDIISNNF